MTCTGSSAYIGRRASVGSYLLLQTNLKALMDDTRTTPEVQHYYSTVLDLIDMVVKGDDITSLLINAEPGIGKSYQIVQRLKMHMDDTYRTWKKAEGKMTGLHLFRALYETRREGDVLFLDDVSGIFNADGLNVMKAATWTEDEERGRIVSWASSTPLLDDVETPFQYRGSVIMCFNELPESGHLDAVKSRSFYYEMSLERADKLQIMREIARLPRDGTTLEERLRVADWVIEHLNDAATPNLRMIEKALAIYCYKKKAGGDWTALAKDVLDVKIDKDIETIAEAIDKHPQSTEAQAAYFERVTGKSRRTFFRKKQQL